MIILGIDPGSRITGLSFLEVYNRKFKLLEALSLKLPDSDDLFVRLGVLGRELENALNRYPVDEVAMESLIYKKNPSTLIKLGQARGVILGKLLERFPHRIFEYSPNLIKSTVSGHGHADKVSIQKALKLVLGDYDYATEDASDATAIALCHALNAGSGLKLNMPTAPITNKKSRGLAAAVSHRVNS